MGLPPGPLAAYLGVRNANEDAGLNTIKQATGIQGLLAKINEQKQLEMARGVMSGSLPQDQKLQNLMNINPALATKYATDMKSLEEYQQGQKFKTGMTALGQNPSQDSLAQLAAQFASPKDILTSQTSSLDRKAAMEQARILTGLRMAGKGRAMTPTAQKELIQTDEEIQGGHAAITSLGQAKKINDAAMGFRGAGIVSAVGTLLPESVRPASVDATENLDNILTTGVLPQLKATFGGMPTEGERKILIEVQGSSSKNPSVRKAIFERAEAATKRRIEFSNQKAKALRGGTYFSDDGTPTLNSGVVPTAQPPTGPRKRIVVDY